VLIIDDVISAGTAIRESIEIIKANGATPAGVVVALDRQERGQGEQSAIQEVESSFGIAVTSIVTRQTSHPIINFSPTSKVITSKAFLIQRLPDLIAMCAPM